MAMITVLQVHGPGADIDTLCVGPSYVNREVTRKFFFQFYCILTDILSCFQEDFFIILHDILAEMEEVTELQPVPDAHVPVMKFKFQGISIDLLYASISLLVVPEVSSLVFEISMFCILVQNKCMSSSNIIFLCLILLWYRKS